MQGLHLHQYHPTITSQLSSVLLYSQHYTLYFSIFAANDDYLSPGLCGSFLALINDFLSLSRIMLLLFNKYEQNRIIQGLFFFKLLQQGCKFSLKGLFSLLGLNACLLNSMEVCHFLLQNCDFLCCSLHHPSVIHPSMLPGNPRFPLSPLHLHFAVLFFSKSCCELSCSVLLLISEYPTTFLHFVIKFSKTWVSFPQDGALHCMSLWTGRVFKKYFS